MPRPAHELVQKAAEKLVCYEHLSSRQALLQSNATPEQAADRNWQSKVLKKRATIIRQQEQREKESNDNDNNSDECEDDEDIDDNSDNDNEETEASKINNANNNKKQQKILQDRLCSISNTFNTAASVPVRTYVPVPAVRIPAICQGRIPVPPPHLQQSQHQQQGQFSSTTAVSAAASSNKVTQQKRAASSSTTSTAKTKKAKTTSTKNYSTADLCDIHIKSPQRLQVGEPGIFTDYGGVKSFHGKIETVRCYESNPMVRKKLGQKQKKNAERRVLVVDGGASKRCAILGDMLTKMGHDNNWAGIIVNGYIRDSAVIKTIPIGVKALGTHPLKSIKNHQGESGIKVAFAGLEFVPGEFVYADEDGIVVSKKALPHPDDK
eukprot:CAMPEP_0178960300 /NCGR_PEP_ID=MMETSP0789-20121207/12886_1 /TAXON_ID=3005 /ORGANISM="Rhizosolenia setigera, Strain CCMP 1694" /LENGTH=378 /DNA_ID=CAMNT_0020643631 /DNA_START=46 /DNA_END=1182 /DNA_ORIENTATION=+